MTTAYLWDNGDSEAIAMEIAVMESIEMAESRCSNGTIENITEGERSKRLRDHEQLFGLAEQGRLFEFRNQVIANYMDTAEKESRHYLDCYQHWQGLLKQ